MQAYLEKKGLEARDIPKAIVVFKALSWTTWAVALPVCYRYQPLRRVFARPGTQQAIDKFSRRFYPALRERGTLFVTTQLERLASSQYFQRFAASIHVPSVPLAHALCENTVLYKLLLPIYVPLQLWATIKLVERTSVAYHPRPIIAAGVDSSHSHKPVDPHLEQRMNAHHKW